MVAVVGNHSDLAHGGHILAGLRGLDGLVGGRGGCRRQYGASPDLGPGRQGREGAELEVAMMQHQGGGRGRKQRAGQQRPVAVLQAPRVAQQVQHSPSTLAASKMVRRFMARA
ncbi:Uncharacterised protein [Bordetella pertussis]|nr:Uncharacterised protein [Bordetella pertussis]